MILFVIHASYINYINYISFGWMYVCLKHIVSLKCGSLVHVIIQAVNKKHRNCECRDTDELSIVRKVFLAPVKYYTTTNTTTTAAAAAISSSSGGNFKLL